MAQERTAEEQATAGKLSSGPERMYLNACILSSVCNLQPHVRLHQSMCYFEASHGGVLDVYIMHGLFRVVPFSKNISVANGLVVITAVAPYTIECVAFQWRWSSLLCSEHNSKQMRNSAPKKPSRIPSLSKRQQQQRWNTWPQLWDAFSSPGAPRIHRGAVPIPPPPPLRS